MRRFALARGTLPPRGGTRTRVCAGLRASPGRSSPPPPPPQRCHRWPSRRAGVTHAARRPHRAVAGPGLFSPPPPWGCGHVSGLFAHLMHRRGQALAQRWSREAQAGGLPGGESKRARRRAGAAAVAAPAWGRLGSAAGVWRERVVVPAQGRSGGRAPQNLQGSCGAPLRSCRVAPPASTHTRPGTWQGSQWRGSCRMAACGASTETHHSGGWRSRREGGTPAPMAAVALSCCGSSGGWGTAFVACVAPSPPAAA